MNGLWYYKQKPIVVYVFDRTDSTIRQEYSGFLTSQLEKLGFTVSQVSGDLSKEISVVYSSDPVNGTTPWSILPEEWGSVYGYYDESLAADLATTIEYPSWSSNYSPTSTAMYLSSTIPYQEAVLTTQATAADKLGYSLLAGNFSTFAQRGQQLSQLVNESIQMATRIWLATSLAGEAYNPSQLSNLTPNFIQDGTAPALFNLISWLTMTSSSGTATIGARHISQGSINPIAGDSDGYSANEMGAINAPFFFPQGSTGYLYPVGVNIQVKSVSSTPNAVPSGELPRLSQGTLSAVAVELSKAALPFATAIAIASYTVQGTMFPPNIANPSGKKSPTAVFAAKVGSG